MGEWSDPKSRETHTGVTDQGVKCFSDEDYMRFDPSWQYKRWHRQGLAGYCACCDVDAVEWRYGEPAKLVELTTPRRNLEVIDHGYEDPSMGLYLQEKGDFPPGYLQSIVDRLTKRGDTQLKYQRRIAHEMGMGGVYICHDYEAEIFRIMDIFRAPEFKGPYDREQMKKWMENLQPRR